MAGGCGSEKNIKNVGADGWRTDDELYDAVADRIIVHPRISTVLVFVLLTFYYANICNWHNLLNIQ